MKTTDEMLADLEPIGMPAMPPIYPRLGIPMIGPEWTQNYLEWRRECWYSVGYRGYFGA